MAMTRKKSSKISVIYLWPSYVEIFFSMCLSTNPPRPTIQKMATTFDTLPSEIQSLIFEKRKILVAGDAIETQLAILSRFAYTQVIDDQHFFQKAQNEWEKIRFAYMRGEVTEFDNRFHPRMPRENGLLWCTNLYEGDPTPVVDDSSWFWKDNGNRKRGKPRQKPRMYKRDPLYHVTYTIVSKMKRETYYEAVRKLFRFLDMVHPSFDHFTILDRAVQKSIAVVEEYRVDQLAFSMRSYRRFIERHLQMTRTGDEETVREYKEDGYDRRGIVRSHLTTLVTHVKNQIALSKIDVREYEEFTELLHPPERCLDPEMIPFHWHCKPGDCYIKWKRDYVDMAHDFYRIRVHACDKDVVYASLREPGKKKIKFPVSFFNYVRW